LIIIVVQVSFLSRSKPHFDSMDVLLLFDVFDAIATTMTSDEHTWRILWFQICQLIWMGMCQGCSLRWLKIKEKQFLI